MTDKFDVCHEITAKWEGGWSDHPDDPGGKTMYGVTQATLSSWYGRPATVAEIRNLSRAEAKVIYRDRYWKRVGGDVLPPGVDLCVYDFGVNSDQERSVKSLQAALGVKADGWVGDDTRRAAAAADKRRLIDELCDRRLAFLRKLPTWSKFGKGWSNRVADVRKRAMAMAAGATQPETGPLIPPEGTPKALPAPPVEKTVSTEQKVGGAAAGAAVVTTALGPIAGFWRDNKDVLSDPLFLVVAGVLAAVIVFLLLRKAPAVEEQA